MNYFFLFLSILLGAIGQIGLKYAATADARFHVGIKIFNEYMVLALGVYFISVILYTFSLRELPLNIAYPSVALSYVIVSYLSHMIWQTPFGIREITALSLILLAISLLVTGR